MKRLIGMILLLFVTTAIAAPLPADILETKVNNAMQDHEQLNPTYWQNDTMKPEIRAKLKQIGQVKFDELKASLPNIKLKDILFSGSLANYNYTKSSDINIHLIVDVSNVSCDRNVVDAYVNLINGYWFATANLSVLNTPLQVTVLTGLHETGGFYSLFNGTWINKPTHPNPTYTKRELTEQVKLYHLQIHTLQEEYTKDSAAFDCPKAEALLKQLKGARGTGLKRDGYSAIENNTYRILRSVNDLKVLNDLVEQCNAK
jgi:hypothetical protein